VSDKPLTTNFMNFFKPVDYRSWVADEDFVSNDHYLLGADPRPEEQLASVADLMRTLGGGAPWLLMEHSTSAVNWQPRNYAKAPGQMRRNSLAHVARGADGALFFQWRASRAGAEKFHSGLVPHAGTDSKVWREVVDLGANLKSLAEVAGSRVAPARAAILFDWPSWWAAELDSHPSLDVAPLAELRRWYSPLWERNVLVDMVGPADPLDGYALVVVPAQYLMSDATAAALQRRAEAGATVVVTYFSGIVDERDHIRLGGYPGALRDLLGVRVEEFFPLRPGEQRALTSGASGTVWSELGRVTSADSIADYADGPVAGSPAITRRSVGSGAAWYVGTVLDDASRAKLVDDLLSEAEVEPTVAGLPAGVEAVRRVRGDASWLFVINHLDEDVPLPAPGHDLLTGAEVSGVPAGAVAVLRSSR
jgi:beta-galactosidase